MTVYLCPPFTVRSTISAVRSTVDSSKHRAHCTGTINECVTVSYRREAFHWNGPCNQCTDLCTGRVVVPKPVARKPCGLCHTHLCACITYCNGVLECALAQRLSCLIWAATCLTECQADLIVSDLLAGICPQLGNHAAHVANRVPFARSIDVLRSSSAACL